MVDFDAAVAAVQDPNADPVFLAKIAYENPEFGANVVANPRAYPGLKRWVAEFGDPTLQTRVRSRIGNDIRTEFRILVRDFRQEHGIGVRILHGRHRGIEIDHHDLLVSWSVTILLNDS